MFKPEYRISDYFLSCIDKIATLQAEIRRSRIRLPSLLQLQKEVFNQNVHSSTMIEGNQLSLNQVEALSDKKNVDAETLQKLEVTNYIKALKWIMSNANEIINEDNFLHIHHLITLNLVNEKKCGKYRGVQNYVIDGKGIVVHRPPTAQKVPSLMQELFEWINKAKENNAIISSAIFHHQLVTIHPFTDGNGRIARAASLWLLYQKQYDPFHIVALDKYFANDQRQYYLKIQQVRELDYDFTYWLDYVAQGVLEAMQNAMRRIHQLAISPKEEILLSAKQEELIIFIRQNAGCGSKAILVALKINRARVNQLISPLVKAGIINVRGKARATRYFID